MPDSDSVVQFPLEKTCFQCQYVMIGSYGFYCSFYKEEYPDETVAEECAEYKPY